MSALTVLLVEDESRLADMIRRGVEAEGWRLRWAISAEAARAVIDEESFDVIVLDRTLPGASGDQWLRELRAQQRYVPVLILTAMGAPADRVAGLAAGADDYLVKPFSFDELIARVAALHRRRRDYDAATLGGGDEQPLQCGPLQVDPRTRLAWLDGAEVGLTDREWELLYHLARHSPETLERDTLMAGLSGDGSEPSSNVVDVYIVRLRRKLGGRASMLQTVRGKGYRLRPGELGPDES